MFTNSSKYAVKALCVIVEETSFDQKLLVKEIAERTDIPRPFLSNILQKLSAKNYISSTKGRNGGFYINEKQLEESLLDIIIEIEGKDRLNRCVMNFEHCDALNPCPVHKFIGSSKASLQANLKSIKLKDLQTKKAVI